MAMHAYRQTAGALTSGYANYVRVSMDDQGIKAGQFCAELYKYVDIEGLKRILAGSVRFTQPSAFNDPFELLPEVVVPDDAAEKQLTRSMSGRSADSHPQAR